MRDTAVSAGSLQRQAYERLYYAVQRLRGSVTPGHVRSAAALLEAPYDVLQEHVRDRLLRLHHSPGDPFRWLDQQPLTDREKLRSAAAALPALRQLPRVEHRHTSGSTGVPLALVKDMEMSGWMDAALWAVYAWHGIVPGIRHARFWGMPPAGMPRFRRKLVDYLCNRVRFDAFSLSPGEAIAFFHGLRRFHPVYAYGYPSLIRYFTAECTEAGLDGHDLGLRLVVTTGELLTDEQRRAIEAFFGCRVVNEYGCTESGILAFECEAHSMHLIPVAAYAQVVRPDGSATETDELGEVVVSDLYGHTRPLLRYRLHDRGVRVHDGCRCGRALPVVRVDSGRVDSFIQTPQRGRVYDAILAYTMPASVQRFRARQVAPDHLVVELVPGEGFRPEETPAICRATLEQALGPGMRVTTHMVQHIAHDPSGKQRYFIPLDNGREEVAASAPR